MVFETTLQYVTFSDRSQIEGLAEYYDSILLSSHLLVGGQKAVTSLIQKLNNEQDDFVYYIDPAITEFRLGESFRGSDGDLKQWHQKLIDELGEPFTNQIERRDNIRWDDLSQDDKESAVESLCSLQANFVSNKVQENVGKYENVDINGLQPDKVIPWYVKIDDLDSLRTNEEIIEMAQSECDISLKPTIHVDKQYIRDVTNCGVIAEKFSSLSPEEYFVWIEDLDRSSTTKEEYEDVVYFVAKLAEEGIKPHFMFGDYFSNLLYYFGLNGTSYGTYYRDSHSEKTASGGGGGGNLQRFYLDPVHEFLSISDAVNAAKSGEAEIPQHLQIQEWGEIYNYGQDHDFLKEHYIKTRHGHKQQVLTEDFDSLLDQLEEDKNKFSSTIESRYKSVEHLAKWKSAFENFKENHPDISQRRLYETQAERQQID